MIRQYIGARYVPKFYENSLGTSAWEAGVIYEPLTIVTWNGNSYTSKKVVPAEIGDPSSNPSYWVATGIFNQQLADLGDRVTAVENDLDALENTIDAEIQDLVRDAKKVIFIGDSFCDANRGGFAYGVFTRFCLFAGLTSGTNAFLYEKGGAGFVGNGQGKTFGDLLDDAIAAAAVDPDEVTDIIVAGGSNDCDYQISDINTAKDAFILAARAAYPNAKIWVAMVGGFTWADRRELLYDRVRYVYNYRPNGRVYPITNAHIPLMDMRNFAADGIHPVAEGCTEIGLLIARAVLENSTIPFWDNQKRLDAVLQAISGSTTGTPHFRVNKDNLGWLITPRRDASVTQTSAVAFAYNTGGIIPIGTVSAGSRGLVANAASTTAEALFYIPASAYALTSAAWVLIQGEFIGVANAAHDMITWYFRCETCPTPGNYSAFRFAPVQVRID